MKLWTIQPVEVWREIQDKGVYRCNPSLIPLDLDEEYKWLIRKMADKIGPPPEGVLYPVWAWYKQNGKHRKPDLRSKRWGYGSGNEDYTCIEIEIPDEKVYVLVLVVEVVEMGHLVKHRPGDLANRAVDVLGADVDLHRARLPPGLTSPANHGTMSVPSRGDPGIALPTSSSGRCIA